MSTVEAGTVARRSQARSRVALRGVALSREGVALAALGLLFAGLVIVTWSRWGDIWLDTGYDPVAAAQLLHAHVPYVDFTYYYGPLGPALLAGVFKLLGVGIGQTVVLGLALALAVVALSYRLARLFVGPVAAAFVGALVAVPALSNSNISYVQPHTLSAPLGMLLCIGALLALNRFLVDGGRRWLVTAGAFIGLTALTRPESFAAIALAVGTWLVLRLALADDRRATLREAALLLAPALVIAVAGYGAFLAVGAGEGGLSVSQLIHADLFPSGLLRDSVAVVYRQLAPMTAGSFAAVAAKLALYAGGVAALAAAGTALARRGRLRVAVAILAGALCVGALAVLVARPETLRHYLRFAFAWLPAGSLLAAAIISWRAVRARRLQARGQLELMLALLLFGFAYSSYALFAPYPNPAFPQETAYAMPVIATFLAWLHVRVLPSLRGFGGQATARALGHGWLALLAVASVWLLVHDARRETVMVHGAHGTIAATAADGHAYQQAVNVIERDTRPGEPVLLAPQMTSLYVMTGRRDPLPQLSLLPGSLASAADERAATRLLDQIGLRLAIVDAGPLTRYQAGPFGVGYDRIVGAWLQQKFVRVATLRGSGGVNERTRILEVWTRRTQ